MAFSEIDLERFLERNRISEDDWKAANITWEELKEVGLDHEENLASLSGAASYIAGVMQNFSKVHSVRWRVKDTEHLLKKLFERGPQVIVTNTII